MASGVCCRGVTWELSTRRPCRRYLCLPSLHRESMNSWRFGVARRKPIAWRFLKRCAGRSCIAPSRHRQNRTDGESVAQHERAERQYQSRWPAVVSQRVRAVGCERPPATTIRFIGTIPGTGSAAWPVPTVEAIDRSGLFERGRKRLRAGSQIAC